MNKAVVGSVIVIFVSGVVNAMTSQKPLTPVILGSYILILLLALLDTFGGQLSSIAGSIAVLAATYVVLTEFPWQTIFTALNGNKNRG